MFGVESSYGMILNKAGQEHRKSQSMKLGLCNRLLITLMLEEIGPLHDPVTWYKITYTGEQVAQWDFQNKGRCIVLEVPLCNLLTGICNFVPCDRVVKRACF